MIPSLRERSQDIPALAAFLCDKYAPILNRRITGISEEALRILCEYQWPGNVRELENAIEYAINYTFDGEVITAGSLPAWLSQQTNPSSPCPSRRCLKEKKSKAS